MHLLVIESNTTGSGMLFLQKAQEHGLSPLFFTNKPQRYPGLERLACRVVSCDTNTLEALTGAIEREVEAGLILGVTTTSEFYLETVARLAASYGVPGNPPEAIHLCRNKALTRATLEGAGVPQPRFAVVSTIEECQEKLQAVGLPCVVKPADDTGSDKVLFCRTEAEVRAQTRLILGTAFNVRGQATARMALIEEYLSGPEYSVETFSHEGSIHCIGVTQKQVSSFPFFVEEQHLFPAPLPAAIEEELVQTVCTTLAALGIRSGPVHTEVKRTERGWIPVEVNARLAGGMIPVLIRLVTEADLLEAQLQAAVGQAPRLPTTYSGYAGIRFLLAAKEGRLRAVEGLASVKALPFVEQVTLTVKPGERVFPARSAYERLGYVIVHAKTADVVIQTLEEAVKRLQLIIE
uniref:ATP-grasp domain-containing protein n=1 Tax=Thermosporothrix sp. COM3 TaxID=2490863 RepID=A0A455SJK1_9CHLR|nr:hypothetical protein KTC_18800 [Thermosporothrix sp. COM3]